MKQKARIRVCNAQGSNACLCVCLFVYVCVRVGGYVSMHYFGLFFVLLLYVVSAQFSDGRRKDSEADSRGEKRTIRHRCG